MELHILTPENIPEMSERSGIAEDSLTRAYNSARYRGEDCIIRIGASRNVWIT